MVSFCLASSDLVLFLYSVGGAFYSLSIFLRIQHTSRLVLVMVSPVTIKAYYSDQLIPKFKTIFNTSKTYQHIYWYIAFRELALEVKAKHQRTTLKVRII